MSRDFYYNVWKLRGYKREKKDVLEFTVILGDTITLQKHVLHEWKLEKVFDGGYNLSFKFHEMVKTTKFKNNLATYKVEKDAKGRAKLVRFITED